jgi:hypothetical protein
MRVNQWLMTSTALLGAWLLVPAVAAAQASDTDKIQRLERQTELLQQQLRELKEEIAQTRRKANKVEAAQAAAPPPDKGPIVKAPPPPLHERVKVTLGGFLAAETVWRQRNQVSDMGSPFGAIPYPFSPLYNENEFHGSARQSRISLLVEGQLDPTQKLSGYYESDFLGTGTTSNYNQSNSWALRLRQAYLTYDNTYWGFHLLGGQAWSLLTQNQVGITPRKENIPLTIDANYLPGFNYTRNWQIRLVQDFGPMFSFGISVEGPATIFGGSAATAPAGTGGAFTSGGTVVNGLLVNFNNPGQSFLTGVTVTTDRAPDVIEKVAFDPGWGHYEVFGVQRFFSDNVMTCFGGACVAGSTVLTGTASEKNTNGWGVGGSVLLPLVPKYLEFTGSVLYGKGIGRYGAGQLPDVTIGLDGSLTPLPCSPRWWAWSGIPGRGSTSTLTPVWSGPMPASSTLARLCSDMEIRGSAMSAARSRPRLRSAARRRLIASPTTGACRKSRLVSGRISTRGTTAVWPLARNTNTSSGTPSTALAVRRTPLTTSS